MAVEDIAYQIAARMDAQGRAARVKQAAVEAQDCSLSPAPLRPSLRDAGELNHEMTVVMERLQHAQEEFMGASPKTRYTLLTHF